MADASVLWSPAPYHILAYGTLLGTQVFQSCFAGVLAYKVLPRPQFATLQTAIFPVYFAIQTALPVIVALTYPGAQFNPSSLPGIIGSENRLAVLTPLTVMFASGVANLIFIGPATTEIMKERHHQETRDGKKSYDPAPHSTEMARLNRAFARIHSISALTNIFALLATIWYGVTLAGRIQ